jgi:TRAP transporter TAXI family solute receptor
MRSVRVTILLLLVSLTGWATVVRGQQAGGGQTAPDQTGYAVKKPVFGGACPTCPWGAMADVVKAALAKYGWDVQICYYCAGGPREARLVSSAAMATPPRNASPNDRPTPKGKIDFGATNVQFLQWAYKGIHDFVNDKEGPRTHLRLVANIQQPNYLLVAVRADSGITDLRQIGQKKMPAKVVARTGIGGLITPTVLDYYGLHEEQVKTSGGTWETGLARGADANVMIGFGGHPNAPEYNMWHEVSQRYDLKYLPLPDDLRQKLAKEFNLELQDVPEGLFRGVDRPIPTVARSGVAVYGRTDMPDEFAYTLAKALDEQQHLFQWSHMNFSYNWRTVWKAFDVPLHPAAARYYKEVGYMK